MSGSNIRTAPGSLMFCIKPIATMTVALKETLQFCRFGINQVTDISGLNANACKQKACPFEI